MPLDVLISEEQLRQKIRELAAILDNEAQGSKLVLIGVLKGSIHFLSDLGRAMKTETEIDFIQVSSYHGGKSSTGVVQIRKDLDINIEGRDVIIVEDIVDTGVTLNHLRELLSTRSPKSLKVVALLSKTEARKVFTPIEHVGFGIPNEFVVGYGLDYAERYRNLPYIAILRED
ncbi:MAG TPA: hypoxanthine phosphoribosyltransferase [Fimbriimonas sp.]|nr:hypoxanthine phosphoribosyltransferase [Fimbriimonas sp.]